MNKLTDIQLVLLSSAAARADGGLLPPPETIAEQMARIRRAIPPLIKRELVSEMEVSVADQSWRQDGDRYVGLVITATGRLAIGADAQAPDLARAEATTPAAAGTKIARVVGLLQRSEGATLAELAENTGWLPHTTRAALTGLRKKGHRIDKGSRDGTTAYMIEAA